MNNLRRILATSGLALAAVLLGDLKDVTAGEGFSISCEASKVVVKYDGELVTNYLIADANKPYFWPVMGPTGKRMTRAFPMESNEGERHDHPHHRSIWFGHQSVGGVDTWLEETSKNFTGEKKVAFLAGLGSQAHTAFTEISANKNQAVIRATTDYLDRSGKQLMADERTVRFRVTEGKLIIDFDVNLIGKYGDVILKDMKDAGLNVRVASSITLVGGKGHIVNSDGIRDGDTWSKSAAWVDYYGPIGGETLGVAFLNHPSSFRHPTPWHVRDYGLFTANAFGLKSLVPTAETGTVTLKDGENILLRHQIIMHTGDEKAAGIAEAFEAYSQE